MKSEKSEFGKGLIICLVKFAEHIERGGGMGVYQLVRGLKSETDKKRCKGVFGDNWEEYTSHQIMMWANGASDHLSEIEVPKGKEWDSIREKVKKLQDKGLEMGHGLIEKIWTKDDFFELVYLTREIALDIDKKIGLEPELGSW